MPNTKFMGHEFRRFDDIELGSGVDLIGGGQGVKIVYVATNQTLTADDSGKTYIGLAADLVFTLPPTAENLRYAFVTKTLSTVTGLSVSPNAADKIMGNGFTSADDKDAINTAATDREGDLIEVTGDGVDGWFITRVIGTYARQA